MTTNNSNNIKAFFDLSYGLYIVSSKFLGKYDGFIANAVFQVTSTPPQIAISCNKKNLTAEYIEKSEVFSISVLQKEVSQDLITLFGYKSGKDINKFENTIYTEGKSGVPIVTQDTVAWFECRLTKTVDVGTHLIYIGEVIKSEKTESQDIPLTYAYYRDNLNGFAPKNAPTYIDKSLLDKNSNKNKPKDYDCLVCSYSYYPERGDVKNGIPTGTRFEDLPDDWVCPRCKTSKTNFKIID